MGPLIQRCIHIENFPIYSYRRLERGSRSIPAPSIHRGLNFNNNIEWMMSRNPQATNLANLKQIRVANPHTKPNYQYYYFDDVSHQEDVSECQI